MAQHVIPEYEAFLHEPTQCCACEPDMRIDEETGEMVFIHQIIKPEILVENLFV